MFYNIFNASYYHVLYSSLFYSSIKIQTIIKVKRNSIISSRNNNVRNKEVELQIKDYHKWKKKRKYGQRWMVETAFTSIKRMFSEHSMIIKFQNMVKDTVLEIPLTCLEE